MNATAKIFLDTRHLKKNEMYPIKLSVTFKRKTQLYQTHYDVSENDFKKFSAPRINLELQKLRDIIKDIEREALECIRQLDPFSFHEFELMFVADHKHFRKRKKLSLPDLQTEPDDFDYTIYRSKFQLLFEEDHSRPGSISVVFFDYVKMLLQEGRIGSAISYKDAYSSIKQFRGNVCLTDITPAFLYAYEQWMTAKGRSRTTVGIKLRNLRAIFNHAIESGIIKREKHYPFGRKKYRIPTGRNIKKSLDQHEISKIYFFQSDNPYLIRARDFWLFCYLGNGMNPKDVIHLKRKNVQGEFFVFNRIKTDRSTRSDPRPITVYITEDMQKIIDRYGNSDTSPDNYLFPYMQRHLDPMQQYGVVAMFTRMINEGIKKVCEQLGLDKKVTTIVSRHSFSTQLKRSGVSTEFIQEALGHTDKRTTENYLDSFENEVKKEFASKLTAFKKRRIT